MKKVKESQKKVQVIRSQKPSRNQKAKSTRKGSRGEKESNGYVREG